MGKPVDNFTPERVTICPVRVPQFSLVEAMFLLKPIAIHSGACERRGEEMCEEDLWTFMNSLDEAKSRGVTLPWLTLELHGCVMKLLTW